MTTSSTRNKVTSHWRRERGRKKSVVRGAATPVRLRHALYRMEPGEEERARGPKKGADRGRGKPEGPEVKEKER